MALSRTEARALAVATLEALDSFQAVLAAPPAKFGGVSPVAVVTSRSLHLTDDTHATIDVTSEITISIYVRCDAGKEDAAENLLDTLALLAALSLYAVDDFTFQASSAGPEQGNLRDVDSNGVLYRVERIVISVFKRYSAP